MPEEPLPEDRIVAHLRELTFEQSLLMGHPGFFAYICGAGTVPGAAAELIAAGLNPCLGGYRLGPGAAEIELHLTRWLQDRYGIRTRDVIGHAESLSSPYHHERVRAMRNRTHGDFVRATMRRYRGRL